MLRLGEGYVRLPKGAGVNLRARHRRGDAPDGWRVDLQVSLPQEVEDLLDAESYASLEECFAAGRVRGRDVVFEDRDVAVLCYVGSPHPEELRHALDEVLAGLREYSGVRPWE